LSTDEGVPDDVTVTTPASQVPLTDYTGTTVFHSRILDHEDLGMTRRINVV
jgi:FtsP/CotA-like multicopper oxidase with cupredoxin domain